MQPPQRKLLLKNFLSPGDIVMLTAAVRDLHLNYPGRFVTDVRTSCPELWEHNPYLTPLRENDPDVSVIDCEYPLINRCNEAPYHCLHGFIDFLNQRLDLSIKPTVFRGDIHLSDEEKLWQSQVHERTGEDTPSWIVVAGGKFDVTIKWWDIRRFQEVVDHFRGKIQFVQVGDWQDYHPPLNGVIDLRGRTDLRQLVRLVHHAQGVLCPVTCLMHLASAVPGKAGQPSPRPCVVVAGGREPVHWEAYPAHQFIHTIGALPCCKTGGCWKCRTFPLGDGDKRDDPGDLCVNVVGNLPRCMDMITSGEVIRRIETYFDGGACRYLRPRQARAAWRAVSYSTPQPGSNGRLTKYNARIVMERFMETLPFYPGGYRGRGVVICAGGVQLFTNAWVCIRMLRYQGCELPIELWHLGKEEMDSAMERLVRPLGVQCVDAFQIRKRHPARILRGWELKPYALLHCRFREVLLLDADNVPLLNPEFLFDTAQFKTTGAIFWPDLKRWDAIEPIWRICGVPFRNEPQFESGQIVVDKKRCWKALRLSMWMNEHSDFFYQHVHGDKDTFRLAFRKLNQAWSMPPHGVKKLEAAMCQHDFEGRRIFQHRNRDKWNLFLRNKHVADFWFEEQCRHFLKQLQQQWDGRMSHYGMPIARRTAAVSTPLELRSSLRIEAWMISCADRAEMRQRTLQHLAATDWGERPVRLQIDERKLSNPQKRQTHISFLALRHAVESGADYILFLEDDLEFNRFFYENLCHWAPLAERRVTLAGLYNPGVKILACDVPHNTVVVDPFAVFGSQAFLVSRPTARYLLRNWTEVKGMQDIKMSRLAGRLRQPVFYHSPSLVQHVGANSVWGGVFHQATDYDPDWKYCC